MTFMVRNIPPDISLKDVLQCLEQDDLLAHVSFCHLPMKNKTRHQGFFFINLTDVSIASRLWDLWEDK